MRVALLCGDARARKSARFLEAVPALHDRVALVMAYAAGPRFGEVSRLKPSAIDSQRMLNLITVLRLWCPGNDARISSISCVNKLTSVVCASLGSSRHAGAPMVPPATLSLNRSI